MYAAVYYIRSQGFDRIGMLQCSTLDHAVNINIEFWKIRQQRRVSQQSEFAEIRKFARIQGLIVPGVLTHPACFSKRVPAVIRIMDKLTEQVRLVEGGIISGEYGLRRCQHRYYSSALPDH